MARVPRKKAKPVSDKELARKEWCSRNFRINGIVASIYSICSELGIPYDTADLKAYLTVHNNRDGRAKGLNIT